MKEKGGKEKGGEEKEGRGEWEEGDYILILRRFYEAVPHVGLQ